LKNFYFKWLNADMICLVFDITNKESFGHTKFWYEKVNEILKANNKKIIGYNFKS
jgi:hypothetical protein